VIDVDAVIIAKGSIGNYQYPGGNLRDLQRSIIDWIFTLLINKLSRTAE